MKMVLNSSSVQKDIDSYFANYSHCFESYHTTEKRVGFIDSELINLVFIIMEQEGESLDLGHRFKIY